MLFTDEAKYLKKNQAHFKDLYPSTGDRIHETAGDTLHNVKLSIIS